MKLLNSSLFVCFTILFLIVFSSCKEEPIVEKPETSSLTILSVEKISVAFSFSLINNNGGNITEIGICWDTLDYPKISKNKLELNTEELEFSKILNNLSPDTEYYIRSYAINSAGVGYSETSNFKTYTLYYEGTIQDVENNEYEIISVGEQIWVSENLKTTKLNDNTPIQQISDNTAWGETNNAACCWYFNNQTENIDVYGALYNYSAIETGKLCPQGYHVPTVQEWENLKNYLITHGYNFDGSSSGNKFAKSLASKEGWAYSGAEGCIGNNPDSNNSSGFNVYPSGIRNNSGDFLSRTYVASFWTSTIIDQDNANSIDLFNSNASVYINENPKLDGFSVRCIKD